MIASLLPTKLHIPRMRANGISRPRLTQKMIAALERPGSLILVSGPAGFGKTTLLSEFANQLPPHVAWVSLDESDNDPIRFWTYVIAACQSIQPEIAKSALALLQTPKLLSDETIPTTLINDLVRLETDLALVLDDYQAIQCSSIHAGLSFLVDHLPDKFHLLLSTRVDPPWPLARFRARDQLVEVRAADLRFNIEETAAFLNQAMQLNLSTQDVAALEARTEGWIASLQLAAISMKGRSDVTAFIQAFTGSHVFVAEYLMEEVLGRQPEDVKSFLLQTSILARLNADLCEAVTGHPDSQALLKNLYQANLFILPLDDEGGWFRYHPLFADLLKARLRQTVPAEEIAGLYQRSSRWFAQAAGKSGLGERAVLVSQAIEHALSAADYAYAVQLIEAHAAEILNQWYMQTVEDWLSSLPAEWSAQSPRTNLAFARMHLAQGELDQAAPYLERLATLFADPGISRDFSPSLRADWLALQASYLTARGNPAPALVLVKEALDITPERDLDTLGRVYLALAAAYQKSEEPAQAAQAYQKLIQLGRSAGAIMTELSAVSALVLMLLESGKLHQGFELARQVIERVEREGMLPPICAGLYGELGQIAFHWCQLDGAERYLQRAVEVSTLGGFNDAEVFYAVARSRIAQMRGDLEAAGQELQHALEGMRLESPVVVREEVLAQQINLFLARQDLTAAEQTLAAAGGYRALADLEPHQSLSYKQGLLYNCALRIQLQRAKIHSQTDSLAGELELAERLFDSLLQCGYPSLALESLLLRAQLHMLQGDTRAAQADLATALDLAEPEGFLSVFLMEGTPIAEALPDLRERSEPGTRRVQFIQKILDTFTGVRGWQPAAPLEGPAGRRPGGPFAALTERELDVLRLMTEGQTYAEIAARLFVSINTVRTHVKSIYGKLGVNNRTAALEAARQMKLL